MTLLQSNQIADTAAVTLNNASSLGLGASSDVIGTLTVASGTTDATDVATTGGTLGLNSDVYLVISGTGATAATIAGLADLGAGNREFNVADAYLAPTNEIQTVTINGTPTGGTFTLTFAGQTTTPITHPASLATVQTALEALSTIGAGNVVVAGTPGVSYTVTFQGDLGNANVTQMSAADALTGGTTPSVTVITTANGAETVDLSVSAVISGSSNITKLNDGTLAFTAGNLFTGDVNVAQGTMWVDGPSAAAASDFTVGQRATLGGVGVIGGMVAATAGNATNAGGNVSPGQNGTAIETVGGSVTLGDGSLFTVELNGTTPGSGYDRLDVTGARSTVSLGTVASGATLNATRLPSFVPAVGDMFFIITTADDLTLPGQFEGQANGSAVVIGGVTFTIFYTGEVTGGLTTGGNDVVLVAVSSPVQAVPANVYVDEDWDLVADGNPVAPFDPIGGLIKGFNAFDTIQDAIDYLSGNTGSTTITVFGVGAGGPVVATEYGENVIVPDHTPGPNPTIAFTIDTNATIPTETLVTIGILSVHSFTMGQDLTFTMEDADLTFNSTIDAASGPDLGSEALTITQTNPHTVTFSGVVGGTGSLADLDVTATTINLNADLTVSDVGANTATFTGAVMFGANVTIDTDGVHSITTSPSPARSMPTTTHWPIGS